MSPRHEFRQPSDQEVEAFARLLFEGAGAVLHQQVSKITVDVLEYETFFLGLGDESDRALAVITFSFIDEKLRELMIRQLNPAVPGGPDKLFDPLGPLGTASARLKLALALGWIMRHTYDGLNQLRKIRNEFAHRPFLVGFHDQQIQGYFAAPSAVEERLWMGKPDLLQDRASLTPRTIFHIRAALSCQFMMVELLVAPLAIRLGLPPFGSLLDGKPPPEPLKQLFTASSRVILSLARRDRQ